MTIFTQLTGELFKLWTLIHSIIWEKWLMLKHALLFLMLFSNIASKCYNKSKLITKRNVLFTLPFIINPCLIKCRIQPLVSDWKLSLTIYVHIPSPESGEKLQMRTLILNFFLHNKYMKVPIEKGVEIWIY
jgi:hypothetical protein